MKDDGCVGAAVGCLLIVASGVVVVELVIELVRWLSDWL